MKTTITKTIFLLAILCQCIACSSPQPAIDISSYRHSVFQWIYPEYNLKAEVAEIKTEPHNDMAYRDIDFFGFTAKVPSQYTHTTVNVGKYAIAFKGKNNKTTVLVSLDDEAQLLCSENAKQREMDFCSSFDSAEEYYHKMYTMTADDIDETTTTGDMFLIHSKGVLFEKVEKIKIYKGDDFTAYANFHSGYDARIKEELIIFHDALPKHMYFRIGLRLSESDAETFLATLGQAPRQHIIDQG
ncbi:hypothetical protein [Desulfoluna spongiiphila]|uniref:hypothetical protein n=1 Tax=Desulfoluna spongiiphila TaxID=419481 RepID=UPI00125106EB|nr:hypothetical protein [Desulfoluna spongiiphila]VVS95705.1 hypothetical protein DBB_52820 [Desulfoluna spongiiphila]